MIIVPTHITRTKTWLKDCLESLNTDREVVVLFQGHKPPKKFETKHRVEWQELNGFDPGAIVWARENCKDEEFFVLHDSCVVKDNLLWKVVFEGYWEESVAMSTHPTVMGVFLGKYRTKVVKQLDAPIAKDKDHAVNLEVDWNMKYCQLDYPVIIDDPLNNSDVFEEKHDRNNMVLENKFLKKYKGAWNRNML